MLRPVTSGVSTLSGFVANGHQAIHPFPHPPLKFRTAGFPQYGFKLEFGGSLRLTAYMPLTAHVSGPCGPRGQDNGTFLLSAPVQRPLAPLRVIVSRWIVAYYGLIRATRTRLAPYFLRLPSIFGASGSPLYSAALSCRAIPRTPADRMAACDCFFAIRWSLQHLRRDSASACSCLRRFFRTRNEADSGSLALRPDRLLARHRHGRLRSSFQLRSHLPGCRI
jgi:hypothetical protein